ncbi:MAG: DUF411 domain-containing protein [Rhodothermales bacterium]
MDMFKFIKLSGIAVLSMFVLSACTPSNSQPRTELASIVVYKTPTCGCCKKWVTHLEEAGFTVKTTDLDDLSNIKQQFGVPQNLRSCHTAVVDGYVVEGHVPADVVQKMLTEKPEIAGISVPGMPIGSPGMEVEGRPADRYKVLAFKKDGRSRVFAER